jgi:hypothetical protein
MIRDLWLPSSEDRLVFTCYYRGTRVDQAKTWSRAASVMADTAGFLMRRSAEIA